MRYFYRTFGTLLLAATLLTPLSSTAIGGLSFGGRIITVTHCAYGFRLVTILPAGGDPNPVYIWTPTTLNFSISQPYKPGQEILGLAGSLAYCYIPPSEYIPGQYIILDGTSPS